MPYIKPPQYIVNAFKKGLKLHKEGKSGSGLMPATVRWATRIVNGDDLTHAKILKASSWFARHASDKKPGWDKSGEETPGYVAWLLWGDSGDGRGRSWMDKQAEKIQQIREDTNEQNSLKLKKENYMKKKVQLQESASFIADMSAGIEDGAKYGLKDMLGVISGEAAKSVLVNKNGRLYKSEEMIQEAMRLKERIYEGDFVEVLQSHPSSEKDHWDIVAKLIDVDAVEMEGGVVVLKAKFAIMNTVRGRDLIEYFKQGVPIGVSLRGKGYLKPHMMSPVSPFYDMNRQFEGKEVSVVEGLELETFDLVRDPSAGTYISTQISESVEAQEVYENIFKEDGMSEKQEVENIQEEVQKEVMGELARDLVESAKAELSEAKEELSRVSKELNELRESSAATISELSEKLGAFERKAEIEEAVSSWKTENPIACHTIMDRLMVKVEEGKISDVSLLIEMANEMKSLIVDSTIEDVPTVEEMDEIVENTEVKPQSLDELLKEIKGDK